MGIPKFYRWISERYPCLSEKIREYQIPDFDNLYLDMNGIIHTCSHPNDDDVHLRISEEVIFREIFRYIDFLFRMIKPRKVFFMAIDGVAPRAKMNQQRGRRFRSAKLALDQEAEALKKGEQLPSEERFDSNCITPGTEFMAKLHDQLQYFVKVKVSTDPLWQREGLVVYLSGHDVPGEGEHKIMDYIRHIRSQPEYDAETRHCLYGLDADLIMLGLSTHELHFSLLREEVKFGQVRKRKRQNHPQQGFNTETPNQKPKETLYDLSNASLFKVLDASGIPESTSVGPIEASSSLSLVKPEQSYSGTVKIEGSQTAGTSVSASSNIVQEISNVEKGLMPSPTDKDKKKDTYHPPLPEKTTFLLLHLSLLRDYIDEEFSPLKESLKDHPRMSYDLEKVIDDWILMSILVGNDFVPNLPHLHITTNALPMVYSKYMDVLPRMEGYLNENGALQLDRFEIFLRTISVNDVEHFRSSYDDMKYMASKTGKNIVLGDSMMEAFEFDDKDGFKEEAIEFEEENESKSGPMSELQMLINRTEEDVFGVGSSADTDDDSKKGETAFEAFPEHDGIFEEDDSPELRLEFVQSKRNYYMSKMEFKEVSKEVGQLAREYIRAVQWVLLYYYKGVSSWCWYYPAHYAPYASDLRNFKDMDIFFERGQPFKPFQQLLAVLPSQSKKLLPGCYQWLMTNEESPIINFYPEKFEQDLNGKKQDWEAVILIPFIEESQLLVAMEAEASKLSEDEKFRNSRGKLLLYSYTKEDTGPVESPGNKFPPLSTTHFKLEERFEVNYDPNTLPKGIHPMAKLDTIYQGFPTIKSIPHNSYLMDAQVKVFEMTARDVSMVLDLTPAEEESDEGIIINKPKLKAVNVSKELLGKTVWVNWPHLTPALVTGISDSENKYVEVGSGGALKIDSKYKASEHDRVVEGLEKRHMTSKAIKLGDVDIVIWAKLMEGRKVYCNKAGKVIVDNLWSSLEQPFAYQTTITNDKNVTVFSTANGEAKTFQDIYRPGDTVFLLDHDFLGAKAVVQGHDLKKARVLVDYFTPVYRNLNNEANNDIYQVLRKWNQNHYFTTMEAARMCNLDPYTFSKISGCIFVIVEKGQSPKKKQRGFSKKPRGDNTNGQPIQPEVSDSDNEDDLHLKQETKKVNVGLDLKFNKRNQKARGYTTKEQGNKNGKWNYSSKTIKLVQDYVKEFPEFVRYLTRLSTNDKNIDCYKATDIFPDDPIGKMRLMQQWLDNLGLRDIVQRVDLASDILDDDEIQIIWNHILGCKRNAKPDIKKNKKVPANLLYMPGLNRGSVQPVQGQPFNVLDRIVCADQSASMPLGQRGTIVGLQEPQVREEKDAIEESFKATSATMLLTLIVLPDPQPDIFEKTPENCGISAPSLSAVNKDMTAALNMFLGIGDADTKENDILVTKPDAELQAGVQGEEYKPLPKLVKLFPYQVINISESEVETLIDERSETYKSAVTADIQEIPNRYNRNSNYNNNASNNYNSNSNYNSQKIPSLFTLGHDQVHPIVLQRPSNNSNINNSNKPGNFKYPNFVKASSPADPPVPQPLNQVAVKSQPPKQQQVQRGAGASGSNMEQNNFKPLPPIQILKRPQQPQQQQLQQQLQQKQNNSRKSQPQRQAQGNPIFSLLESSLEQQRHSTDKQGKKKLSDEDKKELDLRVKEVEKARTNKAAQRQLRKKPEQLNASQSGQHELKGQRNQKEDTNLQQQQSELLQLLQQSPESGKTSSVVGKQHAAPLFPEHPPQPQHYHPYGIAFQQHQIQHPHHHINLQQVQFQQQLYQQYPRRPQPQQHLFAQLQQIYPNSPPVQVVAPLMLQQQHPPGPPPPQPTLMLHHQQNQRKNAHSSNSNANGSNPNSNSSKKITASFVPTQVLSGGRSGGNSFAGCSKNNYKRQAVQSQHHIPGPETVPLSIPPLMPFPLQGTPKQRQPSEPEVSIDALLQEAVRHKQEPTSNSNSNEGIEKQDLQHDGGALLLSQLNLGGLTISSQQPDLPESNSDSNKVGQDLPKEPAELQSHSKSRLAANFCFGP